MKFRITSSFSYSKEWLEAAFTCDVCAKYLVCRSDVYPNGLFSIIMDALPEVKCSERSEGITIQMRLFCILKTNLFSDFEKFKEGPIFAGQGISMNYLFFQRSYL
jgi:hypothetical protein